LIAGSNQAPPPKEDTGPSPNDRASAFRESFSKPLTTDVDEVRRIRDEINRRGQQLLGGLVPV
jgi:hypothetical protein